MAGLAAKPIAEVQTCVSHCVHQTLRACKAMKMLLYTCKAVECRL